MAHKVALKLRSVDQCFHLTFPKKLLNLLPKSRSVKLINNNLLINDGKGHKMSLKYKPTKKGNYCILTDAMMAMTIFT